MDLTTHCPQCATAFLVSENQLELAQGWVRCGVCQEVFMAQAHTVPPREHAAATEEPFLQRQESIAADGQNVPLDGLASNAFADPTATQIAGTHATPVAAKANYRRASLGAMFFLIIMLAVQSGLDAFGGLPGAQPKLTFWLQSLCPPYRCALRQSSALAIDDSSLTSAGINAFHLKATISNRSDQTLEAPFLALTLTDAADEVLARKIYSPEEWAAQTEVLRSSSATPVDLWVRWDDPGSTSHVTGYRLQAFYR